MLWLTLAFAAPKDPPIETYLAFVDGQPADRDRAARRIRKSGRSGHVPMLLEIARFSGPTQRSRLMVLAGDLAGTSFRGDHDAAWQWAWAQPYSPHAGYGTFKSTLYAGLDARFATYFDEDATTARIRLDEIRWGGVKRDGIPPLDHPSVIPASDATYLADSDIVFGVAAGDAFRAYPKRILAWHELVRDTVGGEPVLGVYCTLCGAMIVYDPVVDGTSHQLGTSGFLYRSNKLMYDAATESLWSTLTGEPVVGPLAQSGIVLEPGSVVTTTWGAWRTAHPDTTVLSLQTGHDRDYSEGAAYRKYFATDDVMFVTPDAADGDRLANKASVLALRFGSGPAAAVVSAELPPVVQGTHGGQDFVVVTEDGAHRVFDATGLELRWDAGVVDASGTRWDVTEHALVRADGARRERLPAHQAFWFGWRAAFPDGVLLTGRLQPY